jgi:hypothetical protein
MEDQPTVATEAYAILRSLADLQNLVVPPLDFVSNAPNKGKVMIHGKTNGVLLIENIKCREVFYAIPPRSFVRVEVPARLNKLQHKPCTVPSENGWLQDGYEATLKIEGEEAQKTIWCFFKKDGDSSLGASRTLNVAELDEDTAFQHCRYLLHVILTQTASSGSIPVAVPVAEVAPPVRDSTRIKTVLKPNGRDLVVAASSVPGLCYDKFTGFSTDVWSDDSQLKKILHDIGYSRCKMVGPASRLSIKQKYSYEKVELTEDKYQRTLNCVFRERKEHRPDDAIRAELVRSAPKQPGAPDEVTTAFNARMEKSDKRAQKNECKDMLNSFIKIHNELYRTKRGSVELADVLLPEIEKPVLPTVEEKTEGLSFGIVFLIITLVAVGLVAGFYVWKRFRPSQPKTRVRRTVRRREISDI